MVFAAAGMSIARSSVAELITSHFEEAGAAAALVAQLVERETFNLKVSGSSPAQGASF